MPKYYYTDPLKAAYMAREFGIKIYQPEDAEYQEAKLSLSELLNEAANQESGFVPVYAPPYCVHPDCLEMLKPQVGDLIEYSPHKTEYIAGHDRIHHEASMDGFISLVDFNNYWGDEQLAPIIQRNGNAFFTPEISEE